MDKLQAYWASAPGIQPRSWLRRALIPVCATLYTMVVVGLVALLCLGWLDNERLRDRISEILVWTILGALVALAVYPVLLYCCFPSPHAPIPDAWFTLVYERPDKARLLGDVSDWIVPQPKDFDSVAQRLVRLEGESECDYFVRVCIMCNAEDSTESTLE
jgi:hypothetical protein